MLIRQASSRLDMASFQSLTHPQRTTPMLAPSRRANMPNGKAHTTASTCGGCMKRDQIVPDYGRPGPFHKTLALTQRRGNRLITSFCQLHEDFNS